MSYILEALKKSQQSRALGQVPTVTSGRVFEEDRERPASGRWNLVAVALAGLAVAIALHGALRAPPSPAPAPVAAPVPAAPPPAPAPAAGAPVLTVQDLAQIILALTPRPEPVPVAPERAEPERARDPELFDGADGAGLDPLLERELQRQRDLEAAAGLRAEAAPDSAPETAPERKAPEHAPVPPDLVADIETFKQQLRREKGIPPPPERQRKVRIDGDPTQLRLTPRQQAQVPAYLMTAHVHDADPAKRFVVINTLRYREGDETLEGLRIERILPEGAVLSYLGNPFFVPR